MRYLVTFSVSEGWAFPDQFQMTEFPGLLECRLHRAKETGGSLLTYWKRPDIYFQAHQKVLAERLSLPDAGFHGYETRTVERPAPWWRRLGPMYTTLVTAVAIGTNLESLRSLALKVWAVPNVALVAPAKPVQVTVGDPADVQISVQNQSVAEVDARITSFKPPPELSVRFEPRILLLPKGQIQPLSVSVTASRAGTFQMKPEGSMRSGWLHGTKAILQTSPIYIDAWPRIDSAPSITLAQAVPNGAMYYVRVRHGRPPATPIQYQMSALQSEGVSFTSVEPGDVGAKVHTGNQADVVWKAIGTPYVEQAFKVEMATAVPKPPEFWKKLTVQVYVEP